MDGIPKYIAIVLIIAIISSCHGSPSMEGCYVATVPRMFNSDPAAVVETRADCVSQCLRDGFKYAAIRPMQIYGPVSECYCGDALTDTPAPGLCNMPCAEDERERCGGFHVDSDAINAAYVMSTSDCLYEGSVTIIQQDLLERPSGKALLNCSFEVDQGSLQYTDVIWSLNDIRGKPVIFSYSVSSGEGSITPGYEYMVAAHEAVSDQGVLTRSSLLINADLTLINQFRCEVYVDSGLGCADMTRVEFTEPTAALFIDGVDITPSAGDDKCNVTMLPYWFNMRADSVTCTVGNAYGMPGLDLTYNDRNIRPYDQWDFDIISPLLYNGVVSKAALVLDAEANITCTISDGRGTYVHTCQLPEAPFIRNPGMKSRVTQNGLNYARDVITALLMKIVHIVKIPDVTTTIAGIEVIGTNIRVTDFPEPEFNVSPIPGMGIRWLATRMRPTMEADYTASWGIGYFAVTKTGTVKVVARNLGFDIEFFVGRTYDGKPDISVLKCTPSGVLRIKFKGGWADTLNFGSKIAGEHIKRLILAQICANAKKQVEDRSRIELAKLPTSHIVEHIFSLDYGLTKFPQFYQNAFETFHRGEVSIIEDGEAKIPPFDAPEMNTYLQHTDRMAYVYITDHVLNSAFYAAFESGRLTYNVTAEDIPLEARAYLSTSCDLSLCLSTVFPQLSTEYPDGKASLEVYATEAPTVEFLSGAAVVTAGVNVKIFITVGLGSGAVTTNILTIHADLRAGAAVHLNNRTLTYTITEITPEANILETILGDPEGAEFLFDTVVRVATAQFLLPKLTEIGEKGVVIPEIEEVRFENPTMLLDPHVLMVASDIYYNGDIEDIELPVEVIEQLNNSQ